MSKVQIRQHHILIRNICKVTHRPGAQGSEGVFPLHLPTGGTLWRGCGTAWLSLPTPITHVGTSSPAFSPHFSESVRPDVTRQLLVVKPNANTSVITLPDLPAALRTDTNPLLLYLHALCLPGHPLALPVFQPPYHLATGNHAGPSQQPGWQAVFEPFAAGWLPVGTSSNNIFSK